jgi:hypothetical protein
MPVAREIAKVPSQRYPWELDNANRGRQSNIFRSRRKGVFQKKVARVTIKWLAQ